MTGHTGRKLADEALVLALAQGQTIDAAAEKVGISKSTAHRRLRQPEFRCRIAEIRAEMLSQMVGNLSHIGTGAVIVLAQLTQAKSESVRLSAARAILEFVFRGTELVGVQERLAALESQLKEQEKQTHARRNRTSVNDTGNGHPTGDGDAALGEAEKRSGPDIDLRGGEPGPLADDLTPL